MKFKKIVLLIFILSLGNISGPALADYRFPKPEFSTDYQLPSPTEPLPTMRTEPKLALGVLILVMLLTAIFLYRVRSRSWLRILIILSILYFGFYHGGCVCSVGSIQNTFQSLFNTEAPIALPVMGAFILPLLAALFFSRIFCGAACPLGAIQELVILHPLKVAPLVDRCLKLIPYIYLGLAVLFAACNMGYIICQYDPFVGFFRFSGKAPMFIWGGILLLIGTVIARPYCRYLCPYSVLLRWMAKLSPRKVSTTPDQCVVCHLCRDACPVGAIQPPRPRQFPENKEKALSRLQWISALTPLMLITGMILGSLLMRPLSRIHPQIKMVRELEGLNRTILAERDVYNRDVNSAEAFLMKGGNPTELRQKARKAEKRLRIGTVLFGGYVVLIFNGSLIAATRRRTNEEYTVDVAECVCCARCYHWCPRGRKVQK